MSTTTIDVKTHLGPNRLNTLNNLELSVRFHGIVLHDPLPEKIPVQISISLCDQWNNQLLVPVVRAMSSGANSSFNPAPFPFLLLSPHFEPTNASQWKELAKQIEEYMVANPLLESKHPDHYHLTRELFWMAFIAAYPEFPRGKWPRWDSIIEMEGQFVSCWMLGGGYGDLSVTSPRLIIWEQFQGVLSEC